MSPVDLRRILAFACVVSGLVVLAGPGWALVAAGALLFVSPQGNADRVRAHIARARTHVRRGWTWVRTQPQPVARMLMVAALVMVGIGVALAVHPGWGIAATGLGIGSLSLVADFVK